MFVLHERMFASPPPPSPLPPSDPPGRSPKDLILHVAATLFSQKGFDGVSLRELTQTAGISLASVNYHFGSKERLFHEVISHRLSPINAQRLAILHRLQAASGANPPPLRLILDALARPFFEAGTDAQDKETLRRLVARVFMESDRVVAPVFKSQILPVAQEFAAAVARACPLLTPQGVRLGLLCFAGATINALASQNRMSSLAHPADRMLDDETSLAALLTFGVAGFEALARPTEAADPESALTSPPT